MKGVQLSTDERQLITEVLLFASNADICAEWTTKHLNDMLILARKINEPTQRLDNIYIFENGVFENPQIIEQARKDFPNLPSSIHSE